MFLFRSIGSSPGCVGISSCAFSNWHNVKLNIFVLIMMQKWLLNVLTHVQTFRKLCVPHIQELLSPKEVLSNICSKLSKARGHIRPNLAQAHWEIPTKHQIKLGTGVLREWREN